MYYVLSMYRCFASPNLQERIGEDFFVQSRPSSTRRCVFFIQAVACGSICQKITGQFPNAGHIKRLHNFWAVNTYTLTGTPCSPDHNSSKQRWRRTARLKKRRAISSATSDPSVGWGGTTKNEQQSYPYKLIVYFTVNDWEPVSSCLFGQLITTQ